MNQQILPVSSNIRLTDLLPLLAERLPTFSPQLRKAARFVLKQPETVGISSITEMAEAAEVKPNTLVRMAKAIGFEGYEGFRQPFREVIREGRHGFPDRARWLQSIAHGERHGELLTEMASDTISNIEAFYTGLSTARVKAAADLIVESRATYVLGVGIAHGLARNFAYLAGMALESVVAIPKDSSVPVDDLVRARPGDVLLAVTFQPYRTEVVQAVEMASERGLRVIAVTDSLGSPIAREAELVFCVPTGTAQFFTSTVAVSALFETLVAFVVADAPAEVIVSIEQFHARRRKFGVYWTEES